MTTTLSLVIDSARTPQIRNLADMRKASVGVQAATTDYDEALAMRQRGEIGSIKVYPVAAWFVRENPGLRIVGQVPDDPQPLAIGFRQSNLGLLAAVDEVLADMKRDGTYARLAQRWCVP